MAERNSTDRPANQPEPDRTDQNTMRVVEPRNGSRTAWFVAGAVVIALLVVAFVVGNGSSDAVEVETAPAGEVETVDPAAPAEPEVQEPAAPAEEPEATIDLEETDTPPEDDAALPPATEPEAVPESETAN